MTCAVVSCLPEYPKNVTLIVNKVHMVYTLVLFRLVLQVLEELDLMKNIKRFAGSSAGSTTAMCLALGCDSYECQNISDQLSSHLVFGKKKWYIISVQ